MFTFLNGVKMKKMKILLTGMALLTLGSSLNAASFNCHKASTGIEKTICGDRYLSELDGDMGRLYHKAKAYQHDLPRYQKEWIKNRNHECGTDNDCLYKWTENRITNFKNIIGDAKAGIPVNAPKKKHAKDGSVYFPERGIVCDKKSGFCADREGISLGYTREYLGESKAVEWDKRLSSPSFDKTSYTMSNGIYCESASRKCYNNKWKDKVDRHYTDMLFR